MVKRFASVFFAPAIGAAKLFGFPDQPEGFFRKQSFGFCQVRLGKADQILQGGE